MRYFPRVFHFAALVVCACGEDNRTGLPELLIDGAWSFSETLSDPARELTCNDQGSFTFDQVGGSFTGINEQTGSCTIGSERVSNSGIFAIRDGSIVGVTVMFTTPAGAPCTYVAALSGSPPSRATGTVSCVGMYRGLPLNATGSWEMSRN